MDNPLQNAADEPVRLPDNLTCSLGTPIPLGGPPVASCAAIKMGPPPAYIEDYSDVTMQVAVWHMGIRFLVKVNVDNVSFRVYRLPEMTVVEGGHLRNRLVGDAVRWLRWVGSTLDARMAPVERHRSAANESVVEQGRADVRGEDGLAVAGGVVE